MRTGAGVVGAALGALLALVPADALGQCCGDCNADGAMTVDEVVSAVDRALTTCRDDDVCGMGSCAARLAACQTDLADCQAQPDRQRLPGSGQTTAYGPGSDGDVRAGATLSYTDNGDGTITDNVTGLMWEKKDDSGGIHDKDNTYTWSGNSYGVTNIMDGTIATEFLATLNAGVGFAGHADWRVPNIKELQSIVNYEIPPPGPTVDGAFHKAATCTGCADVTAASCSCTSFDGYWSSSTYRNGPGSAWFVYFYVGDSDAYDKHGGVKVRAVRGGL